MNTVSRPLLGLSSGSLPGADARTLARVVREAGGNAVDLSTGKGHQWETDGIAGGVAAIRSDGVGVSFLGARLRLGDRHSMINWALPTDIPLKVFCQVNPDCEVMREQLTALRRHGYRVWVESHRGGPAPADLATLARKYRFGIVVDNLGLAETAAGRPIPWQLIAPHVRAVQVKGFDAKRQHRRLSNSDLDALVPVLQHLARITSITVESRAGAHTADLRLLIEWYKAVRS